MQLLLLDDFFYAYCLESSRKYAKLWKVLEQDCVLFSSHAVFAVSQAYLDHVSRALHYEYGHRGIFVQSLVPFCVASQEAEDRGRVRCSGWLVPHPQVYARHAISTLGISHRTTGYWPHSLQVH